MATLKGNSIPALSSSSLPASSQAAVSITLTSRAMTITDHGAASEGVLEGTQFPLAKGTPLAPIVSPSPAIFLRPLLSTRA